MSVCDADVKLPLTTPQGLEAGFLTQRELEVVRRLAQGIETIEEAESLVISQHTVRNNVRDARRKLGARSRLKLLIKAIRRGILEYSEVETYST